MEHEYINIFNINQYMLVNFFDVQSVANTIAIFVYNTKKPIGGQSLKED